MRSGRGHACLEERLLSSTIGQVCLGIHSVGACLSVPLLSSVTGTGCLGADSSSGAVMCTIRLATPRLRCIFLIIGACMAHLAGHMCGWRAQMAMCVCIAHECDELTAPSRVLPAT
jgi:hypothetical protein